MNQPLFSILIANYNNGRFFKDCYDSIIAQTYQNWEAIIVDDSSTDNSVQIIRHLIGDDKRFKLYHNEENKGCGFTKRRCVELASGEICGFLDPDDAITVTALDEMVTKHIEHPSVSLVYSNFVWCDENLNFQKVNKQKKIDNFLTDFFNLNGEISAFATFKNSFYQKTEKINNYLKRAVDQDLYFKLYEVGEVIYLDRDFYHYRVHDGGISTKSNSRKAYFWKWVTILDAAKRRNVNVEDLFIENAWKTSRQRDLELEINGYNKSVIFKILRRLGIFRFF